MESKGISPLISFVLYTSIAILAITIVLTAGIPYIEKIRDSIAIKNSQDFLGALDRVISQVALAGENSKVPVSLQFERGSYIFSESSNEISFVIDSKSGVVSPGVSKKLGPLILHGDEKNIFVTLRYNESNLKLSGFNRTLFPGMHNLIVKNFGIINNTLVIGVKEK